MIINTTPALHASFATTAGADKTEGKFATLNAEGNIVISSSTTLPYGIVVEAASPVAMQAGGSAEGAIMLHSFGGIVTAQVGATSQAINIGTLLKLSTEGGVVASSSTAGDVIVAMALEAIPTTTAGQLIRVILLTPYKV